MTRTRILVALVLIVGTRLAPSVSGADDPAPLLPAEGVWVMRYDDKIDGELRAKPGSEVRWKLSVRNDRVSGSLDGKKDADPTDHRLTGEAVAGKPPIVSLRQDGPKGLVCYYTGQRVTADRIVGTWYDNRGSSGDFEFVPDKK